MWVRGAAIRPVAAFAVISAPVIEQIEHELSSPTEAVRQDLDEAFAKFEKTQPHLSMKMSDVLSDPLDETALALGYFLSIAVWLAFSRAFGSRLLVVTRTEVDAASEALTLEEELRAQNGDEPLDIDDVIAIEQPALVAFVNEHIDAALEPPADEELLRDVDVDDVHRVYRAVLLMILALSYAVAPNGPPSKRDAELLA